MSIVSDTAIPDGSKPSASIPSAPPPLTNGDNLTQAEFLRRYSAMPDIHDAELIEGVVYMPSPVTYKYHGAPHFQLITWLGLYQVFTPGVEGGDNATLRLDELNIPQPDAFLIVLPSHGGQVRLDPDGYITGAPELVAEVAATSAAIDLHAKLAAYLRNGVREYLVWRVFDRSIDWFVSREGRFDRLDAKETGRLESKVLPGLWLDPEALIRGNMPSVVSTVQQGIATAGHAAFVTFLQQKTTQSRP
jgi:Uma2 family endonuclease